MTVSLRGEGRGGFKGLQLKRKEKKERTNLIWSKDTKYRMSESWFEARILNIGCTNPDLKQGY